MIPTISVLMPVYNGERYLVQAIDSILSQTFTDFEFIIVNDGSSDSSESIIQSYMSKDSRIRLISQTNQGVTAALNTGLQVASGKYIARMDADDISLSNRLDIQYEFMESHPDIAVCGSRFLVIDELGDGVGVSRPPLSHDLIEKKLLGGCCCILHPSAMIRKFWLEKVSGYSEDYPYAEDYELWLRIGDFAKFANIPQVLLKYRIHGKSVSCIKRLKQYESICQLLNDTFKRRNLSDNIPKLKFRMDFYSKPKLYLNSTLYHVKIGSFPKAFVQFIKFVKSCVQK